MLFSFVTSYFFITFATIYIFFSFVFPFFYFLFSISYRVSYPKTLKKLNAIPLLSPIHMAAVEELAQLGFSLGLAYKDEKNPEEVSGILFYDTENKLFANLLFKASGTSGFIIVLYSFTENGKVIETTNKCIPFDNLKEIINKNLYVSNIQEHLQTHQKRLEHQELSTISVEEAFEKLKHFREREYSELAKEVKYVLTSNSGYQVAFLPALRIAWELYKNRKALNKPYQSVLHVQPLQSAYYAECYKTYQQLSKDTAARPWIGFFMLGLSLIVSLSLWKLQFNWEVAVSLIFVLLLHELGHAIAMRCFGYSNINMFFLPMFGAVVTGNISRISVFKQSVVLLAGPLPGLICGIWILHQQRMGIEQNDFINNLGFTAFIINSLNLLPILPLDGGKLMEILVFARHPYSKILFSLLSMATLVGAVLYLHDPFPLFIAFFIVLNIKLKWNALEGKKEWQQYKGAPDEVIKLFEIAGRKFKKASFMKQYFFVKSILNPVSIALPTFKQSLLLTLFITAIWGISGYEIYQWKRYTAIETAFDRAYRAIIKHRYGNYKNGENAHKALAQAASQLPFKSPRAIDFKILDWKQKTQSQQAKILENILIAGENGHYYVRRYIARYYINNTLAAISAENDQTRIIQFSQMLEVLERYVPEAYPESFNARMQLAELYDRSGQSEKAYAILLRLEQDAKMLDNCKYQYREVIRAKVGLYLSKHQYAEALATLENSLFSNEMKQENGKLGVEYARVLIAAGKKREGMAQMVKATKPVPDHPGFNWYPLELMDAYIELDKRQEAETVFDKNELRSYCESDDQDEIIMNAGAPWQADYTQKLQKEFKGFCDDYHEFKTKF